MTTDPGHSSSEARLDRALADYLRRIDEGTIDRQAFLSQNPDIAAQLQELLETSDLINRLAGPTVAEASATQNESEKTLSLDDVKETPPGEQTQIHIAETIALPRDQSGEPKSSPTPKEHANLFGDFQLLEMIGRGGMGVVYRARQVSMERIVAVKMILEGRLASEVDVARFYAEAKAAGRIAHPHIVTVYQVGQCEERHYYAMDYIAGKTVAEMIRDGPLSNRQAAMLLKTVAEAVHAAHQSGILHRDLKPANVIVDDDGAPHITDFGLAKHMHEEAGLTSTGATVGTPSYMAPEQAAGKREEIGPATDIYALGAVLYAALTQQPPFRGDSVTDTLLQVIHREPQPVRKLNPAVSRDLEGICLKCLRKTPRRRYASALELAEDLGRFLDSKPVEAKPYSKASSLWRWASEVPLVAGFLGGKSPDPSRGQKAASYLLTGGSILLMASLAAWLVHGLLPTPLESQIRIATASPDTPYFQHGTALAARLQQLTNRPVSVLRTSGSGDNRRMLLENNAEAAFVQSSMMEDETSIVAPLYFETVYVLAPVEGVSSLEELQPGDRILLGAKESANRKVALIVLENYGFQEDQFEIVDAPLTEFSRQNIRAAIVLTESSNVVVNELLENKRAKLIAIPFSRLRRISREHLGWHFQTALLGADESPQAGGIPSLRAPSFVIVRRKASDALVELLLEAIYGPDGLAQQSPQITSLRDARKLVDLNFHLAARRWMAKHDTENESSHGTRQKQQQQ